MTMEPWQWEDAFNLFAGDLLGEGIHRKVFAHRLDPTLVIKAETGTFSHANMSEWDAWMAWGDAKEGRWLAPCVAISPQGRFLLQRRVQPVAVEDLPEKVPTFLTDLKRSNFGRYKGRIVCCDYGSLITNLNNRLKEAHWDDC